MKGSSSKGKSGKYFPSYHCDRGGHKRVSINPKNLEATLEAFFKKLSFKPEVAAILEIALKEVWLYKLKDLNADITAFAEQEIELRKECEQIFDKIEMLSNLTDKLRRLRVKEENLRQDRIARVFTEKEYLEEKNKIVISRNKLTQEIADTTKSDCMDETLEKFLAIGAILSKNFETEDVTTQRYYIELLFDSIQIQVQSLKVRFSPLGAWLYMLKFYNPKINNIEPPKGGLTADICDFELKNNVWQAR